MFIFVISLPPKKLKVKLKFHYFLIWHNATRGTIKRKGLYISQSALAER